MVDFQSRDTRRDLRDESEPEAAPAEDEADEPSVPSTLGIGLVFVTNSGEDDAQPVAETIVAALDSGEVTTQEFIAPGFDTVQSSVSQLASREDVHVLITVGGTGAGPTAVTPNAVEPLFDRSFPGFGELVRSRVYEEVETGVIRLRPTAGIIDETPVFCLPDREKTALAAAEVVDKEVRAVLTAALGHPEA